MNQNSQLEDILSVGWENPPTGHMFIFFLNFNLHFGYSSFFLISCKLGNHGNLRAQKLQCHLFLVGFHNFS